jgi:hypothetical protein
LNLGWHSALLLIRGLKPDINRRSLFKTPTCLLWTQYKLRLNYLFWIKLLIKLIDFAWLMLLEKIVKRLPKVSLKINLS